MQFKGFRLTFFVSAAASISKMRDSFSRCVYSSRVHRLWPLLSYPSRNWASLNFSNIVTNYEESRNIWEIVWFGWPFKRKPFTIHLITIKGISYKRCASKCSVVFLCEAFEIITWNYNFRPSIFLCLVVCVPTIKGVLGRLWNNQKIWPRPYLAFYQSCR